MINKISLEQSEYRQILTQSALHRAFYLTFHHSASLLPPLGWVLLFSTVVLVISLLPGESDCEGQSLLLFSWSNVCCSVKNREWQMKSIMRGRFAGKKSKHGWQVVGFFFCHNTVSLFKSCAKNLIVSNTSVPKFALKKSLIPNYEVGALCKM